MTDSRLAETVSQPHLIQMRDFEELTHESTLASDSKSGARLTMLARPISKEISFYVYPRHGAAQRFGWLSNAINAYNEVARG